MTIFWSPKNPTEVDARGLDFVALLGTGETLVGVPTCSVTVVDGTDPAPSAIKSGAAVIDGTVVRQTLTGGVAGTAYKLTFSVSTSTSRVLVACAVVRVENC